MKSLVLIGFKGCGKTTVARAIAHEMGCPFFDVDQLIIDSFASQQTSCKEIYQLLGEDNFRHLETKALKQFHPQEFCVLATGGGSVLKEENVVHLKSFGRLIYLKEKKETIQNRLLNHPLPAFLDVEHPEQAFEILYTQRAASYEEIADEVVSIDQLSPLEIVRSIIVDYLDMA